MKHKRTRGSLIAITLVATAALFMLPNVAVAAPGTSNDDGKDVDAVLAPTVNDDLFETSRQLEKAGILGARSDLSSLIADSRIAEDGALELVYFSGDARVSEALEIIDTVNMAAPLEIRTVPIKSDPVRMHAIAERLSLGSEENLTLLGVASISGVRVDVERGVFVVTVPDQKALAQTEALSVDGYPVEFEAGISVQAQSRDWDWAPWSGGIALRNTSTLGDPNCTSGFNWQRWSDGERMGSTAEHCYTPQTQSWRYNHGNPVGQRYYFHYGRDVFLMRSYGGINQFAPNVFVGGTTTNTLRTVVGNMATPPVGGAVALSAAKSGLHTATILSNGYYAGGIGPLTITNGLFCQGGDSGGPWLATNTAGNVIAYGQHFGALVDAQGNVLRCLFMPVTPISAITKASIMTG